MDQPDLDASQHQEALRSLARINRLSGTGWGIFRQVRELAIRRPIRLLDLACGGGDLAIDLWTRAKRLGLPIEVHGCDISETALDYARSRAVGTEVHFFRSDLLQDPFPAGFDVVVCSLFLHHLDESPLVELLRKIRESGVSLFLASDLRRGRFGYGLAWIVTRLLSRSRIVHVDGPLSVCAAFTVDEISHLAAKAGMTGHRVWRCWPQRFLLRWERPT